MSSTSTALPTESRHYRGDIDGLRAVAVLSVVFFHAGFASFPGGFVGVDVFFVISGYLITRILLDEIIADRFSILRFYERRIRRIFPALFFVVPLTLVAGALWLTPVDFKGLAESAVAVTMFMSNLLFSRQAGYFDLPSLQKPLLHTWSLAVEEQFYLAFPLVLLAIRRYGRSRWVVWMSFILFASLAANIVGLRYSPDTTFYQATARAWEFLLGSLIANRSLSQSKASPHSNAYAAIGLVLIGVSVLGSTTLLPFQGFPSMLSACGAALVIYAGTGGGTVIGRVLGSKPLAFIGLISYSMYLVHWPVIVFATLFLRGSGTVVPTMLQRWLLIGGVGVVSWLSWRFVEQPFRLAKTARGTSRRTLVFAIAGVVMIGTAAVSGWIIAARGVPGRFANVTFGNESDPSWDRLNACNRRMPGSAKGLCTLGASGKPMFLLWGDSHARVLAPALDLDASKHDTAGYLATMNGCAPLLGIEREGSSQSCTDFNDAVLAYVASRPELTTILLAGRWAASAEGGFYKTQDDIAVKQFDVWPHDGKNLDNAELFALGLRRTVDKLRAIGRHVVLIDQIPEVGYQVPAAYAVALRNGADINQVIAPTRAEYEQRNRVVTETFNAISAKPGVEVLKMSELLCNALTCRVTDLGQSLYRDDNHLSKYGTQKVAPLFDRVFSD